MPNIFTYQIRYLTFDNNQGTKYTASLTKNALDAVTRQYVTNGIRVNGVVPGIIKTPTSSLEAIESLGIL